MHLIVGGRGQGKLSYARKFAAITNAAVSICEIDVIEGIFEKPIIYKINLLVERLLDSDCEPVSYIMEKLNEDHIIICDEVGSGIVPINKKEREYRDLVGRLCCEIAERAERVDRVCCGIPMRIKENADANKAWKNEG